MKSYKISVIDYICYIHLTDRRCQTIQDYVNCFKIGELKEYYTESLDDGDAVKVKTLDSKLIRIMYENDL